MKRRVTITVDEAIYQQLHRLAGRGGISRFIESLVRAHLVERDTESAYEQMALDRQREAEAFEWSEALLRDVSDLILNGRTA